MQLDAEDDDSNVYPSKQQTAPAPEHQPSESGPASQSGQPAAAEE